MCALLQGKGDFESIFACGCRDVFGDAAVVGDRRWGGGWGIDAELWARSKVSSEEGRETEGVTAENRRKSGVHFFKFRFCHDGLRAL